MTIRWLALLFACAASVWAEAVLADRLLLSGTGEDCAVPRHFFRTSGCRCESLAKIPCPFRFPFNKTPVFRR